MTQLKHLCKSIILQRVKSREPLWGGWRVSHFVGSGAFGCVFKIVKEAMGDRAESALKVIYLEKKFDRMAQRQTMGGGVEALKGSLERQVKEILLLYELGGHSNVVTWHDHDVFYMKGKEGLVADIMVRMEYLPVSLAQLLAKDKLPWERALEILTDCLAGLEHIHSKRIIHRDIKPDNIFIGRDGHSAKIGDFGVARKISENLPAETFAGTPLYMAPEVLKDRLGKGYDYRADIYSLGLVAYEMLEGVLPFERECDGDSFCMLERRLAGEELVLSTSLPKGVRETVMGALALDPEQRYSSAIVMREALDRALRSDGRETIRPGETYGRFPPPEEKIHFTCPSCKTNGSIAAKHAGKTTACKCKKRLRIAADGTATIEDKWKFDKLPDLPDAGEVYEKAKKQLGDLGDRLKEKMPRLRFPRKKKKVVIKYKDKKLGVAKNPTMSSESQSTEPPPQPQRNEPSPEKNKKAGSVGQTVGKVVSTTFNVLVCGFLILILSAIFFATLLYSCITY
jgi:serine/threonine protein kinase